MYSVQLSYTPTGGPIDYIHTQKGAMMFPSDDIGEWLERHCPSLLYIEEVYEKLSYAGRLPIGLLFRFQDPRDALLFKLTWGSI